MSSEPDAETPVSAMTIGELTREVRQLREEVRDLRSDVDDQQTAIDCQETEIEELRGDLQAERHARKEAEEELKKDRTQQIARAKADVREDVHDLHDTIQTEQQTRSQADARLKQRLSDLADEADIDVTDADLIAKDKLVRLVQQGPDAVTDRVYPVHERAQALLEHPKEWGRVVSDANGQRVVYTAPQVRPYLNAYFDRSFASSELKRIFEKIEDLAAISPRTVRVDKNQAGEHRLVVQLHDASVEGE
ncbi:hypothetical protein [Halorussus salinus]|uniref:hypothetical protein n=1 Tax=Halorussus salinus TaxID=1364935 RepID=UPI0010919689|nr:hypothetical protein [Halorussus salinus]